MSAPRTWGSSHLWHLGYCADHVRPTHVGIIQPSDGSKADPESPPPHVRTKESLASRRYSQHIEPKNGLLVSDNTIRPTDRPPTYRRHRPQSLHVPDCKRPLQRQRRASKECPPHARGDHPESRPNSGAGLVSAPRTWGSSVQRLDRPRGVPVRPTHVGIIPPGRSSFRSPRHPPHTRGDHPKGKIGFERKNPVRPTPVGIVLGT